MIKRKSVSLLFCQTSYVLIIFCDFQYNHDGNLIINNVGKLVMPQKKTPVNPYVDDVKKHPVNKL